MIFQTKTETYKKWFLREYGERKYRTINSKINSSNKVRKLILLSQEKQVPLLELDYIHCLKETPYFLFSKADTLAMGAVLFLELWHNQLNQDYSYLDQSSLINVFYGIFHECDKFKI